MSRSIVVIGIAFLLFISENRTPGQEKEPPPSTKELQAEIARLKEEIKSLLKEVRLRDETIQALMEQVKKRQKEAFAARLFQEAVKVRLEHLQEQIIEKNRMINNLLDAAGKKRPKKDDPNLPNPPAVFLKGKVSKLDGKDKSLLEIDLGSDSGLEVGHTLEVFRLSPKPLYLGMIRIIAVNKITATARSQSSKVAEKIQVGDDVASRLDR